jgi:hypothetical protein
MTKFSQNKNLAQRRPSQVANVNPPWWLVLHKEQKQQNIIFHTNFVYTWIIIYNTVQ